jgi:hypothetical protein
MDRNGPRVLASSAASSGGNGLTPRHLLLVVFGVLVGVVIGAIAGGGATTSGPAPDDPGPASVTGDGAPQGFAHTRSGAVAAAAAYADAFGAAQIVDEERLAHLIDAIATPELAGRLRAQTAAMQRSPGIRRLQAATSKGGVFAQETPLGYRVVSYQSPRAVVDLWVVSVLAGGRVQPQARFARSRETLAWNGEDWKLAALAKPISGPTPGIERKSATNSSRSFIGSLRRYEELRSGP